MPCGAGWVYSTAQSGWAHVAALAPLVEQCAREGDSVACSIMQAAADELAACAAAVLPKVLSFPGGLEGENGEWATGKVVLVGGLLEEDDSLLSAMTQECILQQYPGVHIMRPLVSPAVGAALLALRHLQSRQDEQP